MGNLDTNDFSDISKAYRKAIEKKSVCTDLNHKKGELCEDVESGSIVETIKQSLNTYLNEASYEKISQLLGTKDIEGLLSVLEDKQVGKVIGEIQKLVNTYPGYAKFIVNQILDKVKTNLEEKYNKAIASGDNKSIQKLHNLSTNFPVIQKFFNDKQHGEKRVKNFLDLMSDRNFLLSFLRVGKDLKDYNSKKYEPRSDYRGRVERGEKRRIFLEKTSKAYQIAKSITDLNFKKLEPIVSEFINFYMNNREALEESLKPLKLDLARKRVLERHLRKILPILPKILSDKKNLQNHIGDIKVIIYLIKKIKISRKGLKKGLLLFNLVQAVERIHPELNKGIKKRCAIFPSLCIR